MARGNEIFIMIVFSIRIWNQVIPFYTYNKWFAVSMLY